MRHLRSLAAGVALASLALAGGPATHAQNVIISGDFPVAITRELPKGTGLILGRVIEAESRQPLDRAIVYLNSPLGIIDPVMTDAQGRFVFRDLPKGQFRLTSRRFGYLDGAFAKQSPDEELGIDGQALDLGDDERLGDVTLMMWKFASIAGVVTDETGDPIVGATVRALPRRVLGGRVVFDLGYRGMTERTDDRGMFRFAGLRPGEYIVAVPALLGSMPKAMSPASGPNNPLSESSTGAGRWFGGVSMLRGAGIEMPDEGFVLTVGSSDMPGFAGLTRDGKVLAYTTAFYSGASMISRATVITLKSGEERDSVNVRLTAGATSRVSGTLVGPNGPAPSMMLRLVSADVSSSTTIDAEMSQAVCDAAGRFTFFGVPPGDYRIQVIRPPATRSAAAPPPMVIQTGGGSAGLSVSIGGGRSLPPLEPTEWADTPVSVGGEDVKDVTVTLRTGVRISGRLQFDGTTPAPKLDRPPTIYIERADGRESPAFFAIGRAGLDAQGNFLTYGQSPGPYFVRVDVPPTGWWFKGAMIGGRDVSVVPLDLVNDDIEGVTLVFTDRPLAEISGTVTTDRGQPATGSVVVFPADRRQWTNSGRAPRNIRAVSIVGGGRYRVPSLPAGAYLVAATTDTRVTWADPKFLEVLSRNAANVTLTDGESRSQNLRLPASAPAPEPESDGGHGPWIGEIETDRQTPARDGPQVSTTGTGAISGVVVTAGENPQPARRVNVTLYGGSGSGRLVVTDESGRFEFTRLPSGRFTLSAAKAAYLTTNYGAARPGRPGTPIMLADGQRMTGITLTLQRGGTISGVIRDERGQPAPGATVQALQYRTVNGERRLTNPNSISGLGVTADDRGVYRMFGLEPGEYTVMATYRGGGTFRVNTEADVQVAQLALKRTPGSASASSSGSQSAAAVRAPANQSYAPSVYPGSTDSANAVFFTLKAGEDKTGIDFAMEFVPTALVQGVVSNSAGPWPGNVDVRLVNTGRPAAFSTFDISSVFPVRPGPDGVFQFRGVVPGRYAAIASTTAGTGRGAAGGPATTLWATADLTVNGIDISGVALSLQPGMTVSGTVAFAGTTRTPPALTGTRVTLLPQLAGSQISVGQLQTLAQDDGSFKVSGVMPGRYSVRALLPTGSTGWLLGSALLKDRDVADEPFEVRAAEDVAGITVTFIDRPAELSGVLQDASGRPAPDYYIILFPADNTLWRSTSRRILQTRPGTDGRFTLRSLVAGDYLLAAATDVDPGEWFDPAFLTALSRAAVSVKIAVGETKVQDIRIAK